MEKYLKFKGVIKMKKQMSIVEIKKVLEDMGLVKRKLVVNEDAFDNAKRDIVDRIGDLQDYIKDLNPKGTTNYTSLSVAEKNFNIYIKEIKDELKKLVADFNK
jgi:hypothetical protein